MIIKKFVAKDSRSALTKIRKEFGPEAILLSSKEVGDHFEMVATPNYDDQDIEQEIALQHQRKREQDIKQELSSLYAKDQQSLKVLQDEMAQMRTLIEAQLSRDKLLLESLGQQSEPVTMTPTYMGGNQIQPQAVQQQSPAARRDPGQPQPQQHIDQHLAEIGVSRRLRESLRRRLQGIQKLETASSKTMQILSGAVRELDTAPLPEAGIAAFVGEPGSGKTTALIKLAQKHRKHFGVEDIGIVLLNQSYLRKDPDANLLGKYADAMSISCLYADSPRQLLAAVKKLAGKKLVLIDSSGSSQSLPLLNKSLAALKSRCPGLMTFLTTAADLSRSEQERSVKRYAGLASAMIVTKTKGARHLGALVELLIRKKLPLGYISATAKLDASIIRGQSEQLIRMALELGNLPLDAAEQSAIQQPPGQRAAGQMSAQMMGLAS